MSGGFLRAMSKLGLVELEGAEQKKVDEATKVDLDEVDRLLAAEEKKTVPEGKGGRRAVPVPAPAPARAAPPPRPPSGDIAEGRPLDDFYASGGVPSSPYPAEKLLKVLDGLRQMDPATRRAAVTAMDAADDSWSIADVVLDAQRKQRALAEAKHSLGGQVESIRAECEHKKAQMAEYLEKARQTIQEKIQQLQQQLANETATITSQQMDLDTRAAEAAHACARESQRLQGEIDRLSEITNTFIVDRPNQG
jgi:hypothetical protein